MAANQSDGPTLAARKLTIVINHDPGTDTPNDDLLAVAKR